MGVAGVCEVMFFPALMVKLNSPSISGIRPRRAIVLRRSKKSVFFFTSSGYDGGDCCSCTCVDTTAFICDDNYFRCIDPRASCVGEDDYDYEAANGPCDTEYINDGDCDPTNNNEDCGASHSWLVTSLNNRLLIGCLGTRATTEVHPFFFF